ncbi:CUB and zona pellucida-like domain-containing protein 1 isoform X2 [Amia ocellicauda]|uniref:CUB and zona pellucida-like domain-containing protein 1 isoform X2 n=1 Tax=Amia ocellicauda TaxID=2972642 RepID=UPI003463B719
MKTAVCLAACWLLALGAAGTTEPVSALTTEQVPGFTTEGTGSCMYNCGGTSGDCSCDSSCEWNNNCCPDFCAYCPNYNYGYCATHSSTAPPFTPDHTTQFSGSCMYNCGGTSGDCSCDSSCQWNNNCCPDFCAYCPNYNYGYCATHSSTAPPFTPDHTTQFSGSCMYNCGGTSGDCSCDSSCEWNNNCCPDYYGYCATHSSTAPPFTPDHTTQFSGSCMYNCGGTSGDCSCDSSCEWNNNCCPDYYGYCATHSSTAPPFTPGSCMYNCGGTSGDCSCDSSCEWNNNCCPDYYEYCAPPTTTTPPSTTTPGSCMYNCGGTSGDCSCDSSCEWNNNCCPDYYGYCATHSSTAPPFTPVVKSCGGSLDVPSGWFSTPNYPEVYPSNSYCVWHITVPAFERIELEFDQIQLEYSNGCVYDSVSVYNGPSTTSPLLGVICWNENYSFMSTSNSMTVVFRSDGSVTNQGFLAQYRTFSPVQVECSSDLMRVGLELSFLHALDYNISDVSVNDPFCRPQNNGSYAIFSIPLDGCGTFQQADNDSITYVNTLRAEPSGALITRQTQLRLQVSCRMHRDSMVEVVYRAREENTANITSSGDYNITVAFYQTGSFLSPVQESPYTVDLNQDLFVQVQLSSSDDNLSLFIHSCVASPSSSDMYQSYSLIRNGCPQDSTYFSFSDAPPGMVRFKFNAFRFLRSDSTVYLQCKVVVCQSDVYPNRCSQGCLSRRRRDLSPYSHTTSVMLGPIQRRDRAPAELQQQQDAPPGHGSPDQTPLVLSLLALVAAVLAVAAVSLRLRRSPHSGGAGYTLLEG